METQQTKTKGKSLVSNSEENDSDDICIVDEVSTFKKYPRGAVIGSHRPRDFRGFTIETEKKFYTIRRTAPGSSFDNLCTPSAIERSLFQKNMMETQQTKTKGKSLVSNNEENDYSDSDDVCVFDEVSTAKKYPRGAVIGSHRPRDFRVFATTIETGRGFNTLRRTAPGSSFDNLCTPSTIKRSLLKKNLSVRLDERHSYKEFIKKYLEMSIVISAEMMRHFFPSNNLQNLHIGQPLWNALKQPLPSAKQKDPPFLPVECVDLTCEDSDSDVVEVPQDSPSSEHDDLEELPCGSGDNGIIDLEDEIESSGSSASSVQGQLEDLECLPISTTKRTEILNVDDDDDDDQCINVEEEEENEKGKQENNKRKGSDSTCKCKPKANLEGQMLHQMILEDQAVGKAKLKEVDQEDLQESQPEITYEMEILVLKAFTSKSNKVLVDAFGLEIRSKDIQTLEGSNWLNDQVINFYMSLLMERGKLSSYPSVYCFNTFFYVKLLSSGQISLKRWTRKIDIFSYDLLIVPLHLKVHWCLACINFIEKRIEYYDSMGGENEECGKALLKYLEDEHLYKKNEVYNISGWEIVTMEDIPEQLNGCDCGVFLCTYAEYICRMVKLTFTQRDMPYFRVKMAYEILTKKLVL